MPKLTKEIVEQIELPDSGQTFYRDTEVPGFAIRATPKCKSYILEKLAGRSNMQRTIGSAAEFRSTMQKEKLSPRSAISKKETTLALESNQFRFQVTLKILPGAHTTIL
jgi:hypothetical protein